MICLEHVFIPCRDMRGIIQEDVRMRESETVFFTLTDVFKNPLIHFFTSDGHNPASNL